MNVEMKIFGYNERGETVINQQQGAPAVSGELFRQHQWLIPQLVVWLRTYGLQQVLLDLVPLRPVAVAQIAFKLLDFEAQLPAALRIIRTEVLQWMRAIMQRFGIHSLSLVLTADEQRELQTYWKYLASGEGGTPAAQPLRYETDPTNQPVAAQAAQAQAAPAQAAVPPLGVPAVEVVN